MGRAWNETEMGRDRSKMQWSGASYIYRLLYIYIDYRCAKFSRSQQLLTPAVSIL